MVSRDVLAALRRVRQAGGRAKRASLKLEWVSLRVKGNRGVGKAGGRAKRTRRRASLDRVDVHGVLWVVVGCVGVCVCVVWVCVFVLCGCVRVCVWFVWCVRVGREGGATRLRRAARQAGSRLGDLAPLTALRDAFVAVALLTWPPPHHHRRGARKNLVRGREMPRAAVSSIGRRLQLSTNYNEVAVIE